MTMICTLYCSNPASPSLKFFITQKLTREVNSVFNSIKQQFRLHGMKLLVATVVYPSLAVFISVGQLLV